MKITLYGIKNCDTMKKARTWLEKHRVEYDFHDYKVEGIDKAKLQEWIEAVGWETLLNRAGTTFRKLPDESKQDIDEKRAIALMLGATVDDQAPGARAGPASCWSASARRSTRH